jgi:hypothetical protein
MTSFFLLPLPEELLLVLRLVVVVACVCCFPFFLFVRLAGIKGKCEHEIVQSSSSIGKAQTYQVLSYG